jgi:hypothetical protein
MQYKKREFYWDGVAFAPEIEKAKENSSLICGFRNYLYIYENEILVPQI